MPAGKKAPKSVILTTFFRNKSRESNSDDDFAKLNSPKRPATPPPVPAKRIRRRQADIRKLVKKSRSAPTEQQILGQILTEHGRTDNVDPDELQLALALSNSEKAQPPTPEAGGSDELDTLQQKYSKVKRTLEGYGFKCKNKYTDYDIQALFGPSKSRKKHHPKPTLLTRRDQSRQEHLMAEKVQLILDTEYKENVAVPICDFPAWQCHGFHIEDFVATDARLFRVNSSERDSAQSMAAYYTKLVAVSSVGPDYLLQRWEDIPGRERTPSPTRTRFAFDAPLRVLDWTLGAAEPKEEAPDLVEQPSPASPVFSQMQESLNRLHTLAQSASPVNSSSEDLFAGIDDGITVFQNDASGDGR